MKPYNPRVQMKRFGLLPMALLLAGVASAQQLDCPGSASRSSDTFHYHVSMYRPDTRGFLDVWGVNEFASQSACDRAREAQMGRNLAVVDFFKRVRGETQYETDRFGNCHADLSTDKSNPRFLTDAQRVAQIRGAEETRERVRERLLDDGVTTDSEIFRNVALPPAAPPALLGGPKLVPMPQGDSVAQVSYSASDLHATRFTESAKPAMASLDLPLVDAAPGAAVPTEVAQAAMPVAAPQTAPPASPPAAPPPAEPPVAPSASAVPAKTEDGAKPVEAPAVAAAPAAVPTGVVATPPAEPAAAASVPAAAAPTAAPAMAGATPTADGTLTTAQDDADSFIAYETQRIQNVLKASSVIADGAVKAKIYAACTERGQLLSNLRALIEGSGAKSRLATMARTVRTEDERLAFVSKLFGSDIKSHWAPADATDVILDAPADTDTDVERVLRDTAGRYNDQQKKRALYLLLAHSQPTEDQQLWLTTIADTFLQ